MKMVVEWDGGGWETDDLTHAMNDAALEAEIAELGDALEEAGNPEHKVRFSGGRRCTREVLDAMQEQYATNWSAMSQLRFLNDLLRDPSDHFSTHLFSLFLLEQHRNEFPKGAKQFAAGYREEYALAVAYESDYDTAHQQLMRAMTTHLDDLGRLAGSNLGIYFVLWNLLDYTAMRARIKPRVHREWEGKHCMCERVLDYQAMGVKEA